MFWIHLLVRLNDSQSGGLFVLLSALAPVLQNKFSIPRIPFHYLASLTNPNDCERLSSHTKADAKREKSQEVSSGIANMTSLHTSSSVEVTNTQLQKKTQIV